MLRRNFYSILAVFICVCSVFMMFYMNRLSSSGLGSVSYYDECNSEEDSEYLGYIFDDYNKNVNLNYTDRLPEKGYDAVNTISISAIKGGNTADNMRLIRSERIIEERADDMLK